MHIKLIRAQTRVTLEKCLSIRHQVFVNEMRIPRSAERDRFDSFNNKCDHFLIEYNGTAVGNIRVIKESAKSIKLERFCILRNYRRKGIGNRALKMLEHYYYDKNVDHIKFDAIKSAVPFYMKNGYIVVSKVFMEVGYPHYLMEKHLH